MKFIADSSHYFGVRKPKNQKSNFLFDISPWHRQPFVFSYKGIEEVYKKVYTCFITRRIYCRKWERDMMGSYFQAMNFVTNRRLNFKFQAGTKFYGASGILYLFYSSCFHLGLTSLRKDSSKKGTMDYILHCTKNKAY